MNRHNYNLNCDIKPLVFFAIRLQNPFFIDVFGTCVPEDGSTRPAPLFYRHIERYWRRKQVSIRA